VLSLPLQQGFPSCQESGLICQWENILPVLPGQNNIVMYWISCRSVVDLLLFCHAGFTKSEWSFGALGQLLVCSYFVF
jgi:hypothetical protein